MKILFFIFAGGGIGSVGRYLVQQLLHEHILPYHFPWATFAVNVTGCFLIGLFYALSSRFHFSPEVRMMFTTGLCGGFTTFSTFSHDGLQLLQGRLFGEFAAYTTLSILMGIGATIAGYYTCNNSL